MNTLRPRRQRPRSRAAEKRDEVASFLIELHPIPHAERGRTAGYRIGSDQSAGVQPQPRRSAGSDTSDRCLAGCTGARGSRRAKNANFDATCARLSSSTLRRPEPVKVPVCVLRPELPSRNLPDLRPSTIHLMSCWSNQQLTEPCCRTRSLPQRGRQVIEADLNCSERSRRRAALGRARSAARRFATATSPMRKGGSLSL